MTVAGKSTRYRRRVKAFDRFTMVSRMVGWDHRFIYIDQSRWKGAECCNQVLIRMAVTSARGIVVKTIGTALTALRRGVRISLDEARSEELGAGGGPLALEILSEVLGRLDEILGVS